MANIGFIGLGIMGKPRAEHLIKGGHSCFCTHAAGVSADLAIMQKIGISSLKVVAQYVYIGDVKLQNSISAKRHD